MKAFKGPKYQGGWVFAAISAVSAVAGLAKGRSATKNQKRANATQRKINELKNKQAKRAFLRNFRQAQGIALSSGIGAGVELGSSRTQATLASQSSQANIAIKEFKEFNRLGAEAQTFSDRASSASFASQAFGTVSTFASQFASFGKEDGKE